MHDAQCRIRNAGCTVQDRHGTRRELQKRARRGGSSCAASLLVHSRSCVLSLCIFHCALCIAASPVLPVALAHSRSTAARSLASGWFASVSTGQGSRHVQLSSVTVAGVLM